MAIYHLSMGEIGRSAGRSSTAAAAYRAGERIIDERTGEEHDYRRKRGIAREDNALFLPGGERVENRAAFWNKVETHHTREKAIVAREIEVSLPHELTPDQRRELAHAYGRELADRYGVAADVCIHAPGPTGDNRNHHAHILLTACACDESGKLGKKVEQLDPIHQARRKLDTAADTERPRWAQLANEHLEKAGHDARIDHRSNADRGIMDPAGEHMGPTATGIERKGQRSRRGEEIANRQAEHQEQRHQGAQLQDQIQQADQEAGQIRDQLNQENQRERTESARRSSRAYGIEPLNRDSGTASGAADRAGIERRDGPRQGEPLAGGRAPAPRAADAVPELRGSSNRGDGHRKNGDLLPAADAGHGPGDRHQVQPAPAAGPGAAEGLNKIAKGVSKAKPKAAPKKKPEQEVESQFQKFTKGLGQVGVSVLNAFKQQPDEQPKKPAKPSSQQTGQPASQKPQQATNRKPEAALPPPPTQKPQEQKPQEVKQMEPKPRETTDVDRMNAKILECDARIAAENPPPGQMSELQRLARSAKQDSNAQSGAMKQRQVSERALELARRAGDGDPAARDALSAAAGRLAQPDQLGNVARFERNVDNRAKIGKQATPPALSYDRMKSGRLSPIPTGKSIQELAQADAGGGSRGEGDRDGIRSKFGPPKLKG